LAGYVLEKFDCSPGPLIIAMILGPILEENMRRAMLISQGDPSVFVTRPISAVFIFLAVVVIVSSYFRIKKAMEREQQNAFPADG
jgi:TctA family transporter